MNYTSSFDYEYNDRNDTRPSHIYYDLTTVNNDTRGTLNAPNLKFVDSRGGQPFLPNPQEYFASIVRFQLESPYLPLWIAYVQTGQSNVNLSIYQVSLSYLYLGTVYTQSTDLLYVPENLVVPTPASPTIAQDFSTEYYWGMSYQRFLNMVNTAYATCLTGLNAQVVGAGGVLPSAHPPFFTLDQNNYKFTLNADSAGYNVLSGDYIKVYSNESLGVILSAFDSVWSGAVPNRVYQYKIYPTLGNTFVGTVAPYAYTMLQMTQAYSTTVLLCPIKNVSFQSNNLPIQADLLGRPAVFTSDNGATGGVTSNSAPILTDFVAGLQYGFEYKPNLIYSPAVYRLLHMSGNNAMKELDLSVYWGDSVFNNYPIKLLPQRSSQIKILFRLKSLGV